MSLKGKVAFITGASSGIGRATALLFASEGARVAVVDVDEPGGQQTVALIGENGGDAAFFKADVTSPDDISNAVRATVEQFDALHLLYNNAGVSSRQAGVVSTIDTASEEEWDRIIGINLTGVFLCSKYAVPEIKRSGGGAIVNTASIAGMVSLGSAYAYSASKAGVSQITKNMAMELAKEGIRVNAVAPGFVDTPMTRGVRSGRSAKDGKEAIAGFAARTPIGRAGKPEEIANAVLFLCSDNASFVTGHTLVVDGGYTTQ